MGPQTEASFRLRNNPPRDGLGSSFLTSPSLGVRAFRNAFPFEFPGFTFGFARIHRGLIGLAAPPVDILVLLQKGVGAKGGAN